MCELKINGYVYGIFSQKSGLSYFGSTCNLSKRKSVHKSNFKKWNQGGRVGEPLCSSAKVLQYDDSEYHILEDVLCTKKDLHILEGNYIREHPACVNMRIAGRGTKQYHLDNKAHQNKRSKKWRENHCGYFTKYYEDNKERYKQKTICECGAVVRKHGLNVHKKSKKHALGINSKHVKIASVSA